MKLFPALAAVMFLSSVPAFAQEKGTWHAASKTARSITGDVSLAPEKMSMNFYNFPIAQIRTVTPAEIGAAFDADAAPNAYGNLYRLSIPADKKFFNKNTLCGSEETQWMVTYVAGKTLQLAFFSGPKMPVLTTEAMVSNTTLCGTYAYVK
jgi:hypothetical protein